MRMTMGQVIAALTEIATEFPDLLDAVLEVQEEYGGPLTHVTEVTTANGPFLIVEDVGLPDEGAGAP